MQTETVWLFKWLNDDLADILSQGFLMTFISIGLNLEYNNVKKILHKWRPNVSIRNKFDISLFKGYCK